MGVFQNSVYHSMVYKDLDAHKFFQTQMNTVQESQAVEVSSVPLNLKFGTNLELYVHKYVYV